MIDPALTGFVFFGLFSPGPNVIMLTASGARFGFRATVPHLLGVVIGVGIIAGATGLGIGSLVQSVPGLELTLKVLAGAWIIVMAYRLWHAAPAEVDPTARPFTLIEGLLFQAVNPKVWAVAFAATGYLAGAGPMVQAQTLAQTFSVLNLGVCLFWTMTGHLLARLLRDPVLWRGFMRIMAAALLIFAGLVFL